MTDFASEHGLEVSCVMTAYTKNDEFYRELVVCFHSESLGKEFLLQQLVASDLDLELIKTTTGYTHYQQRNIRSSRKQVQPILQAILLNQNE